MAAAENPHDNVGWHLWVGTLATIIPATLSVFGRCLARWKSAASFWWDDWFILGSLFVNWWMAAIRFWMLTHYHLGRHAEFVSAATLVTYWKAFLTVQITYFLNAVLTKTSIVLLYYRIFAVGGRNRIALYVTTFLVWSYFIGCTVASIAGCDPVSKFWHKKAPGKCIDEVNFFRWNGIVNMLLDVLILALPLPMVWTLKTRLRQKLILSSIFLLGAFTCVVSILRIIAFNKSKPTDPTYTSTDTQMWSSVEQSLGILCACLPTLRPLFQGLYDRRKRSKNSTQGQGSRSDTVNLSSIQRDQGQPKGWRTSQDTEGSTVGFAQLTEDGDGSLTPEIKKHGLYAPADGTVSNSARAGGADDYSHEGYQGILMTKELHQRSDVV